MKAIFQTSQFKKDLKRINKRSKDLSKLDDEWRAMPKAF
jgi:mRNA-degrading endonuclease YafQ of YafQ-DinJ toxin-antitoxin module